jgi:hypothetical protein
LIGDWRDSEPRVVRAVHVARWTVGVLVLLLILGGLLVAIANPI